MNKRRQIHIALALMLLGAQGAVADSPYTGQETRAIKALSDSEIADYRDGHGMGESKAAELNHYPGPKHVLDAATDLQLTADQRTKTTAIYIAMEQQAKDIGRQIIAKEAELEALYATRQATTDNTRRLVDELAKLHADFRFTHLSAHLAMPAILTPRQVAQYDELRGYGLERPKQHGHEHKHPM